MITISKEVEEVEVMKEAEEKLYQLCRKLGHIVVICWYHFDRNFQSLTQGLPGNRPSHVPPQHLNQNSYPPNNNPKPYDANQRAGHVNYTSGNRAKFA